uniref:Polymerase nucleotidyl transferase domain-containing protein n=1 Tax=viral metagenome TaxID=1070528 RepID=A0A6C0HS13_9ZZZZ
MEYEKLLKIPKLQNKLFCDDKNFLHEMQNYLGIPIYIYGSILRSDYFPDKSDIDVAIFANDTMTVINKLVIFLGINRSKIKVFKLETNKENKIMYGFKTNYILNIPRKNLFFETCKRFEISIYNIKDKDYLINYNIKELKPSFIKAVQIFILKYLYYYIYLDHKYYKMIKERIFNTMKEYHNKITIIASL